MPRDKRLWMTFPIDFWQHPKIAPLSDAAFRVFVELNGYSRMQDLDGRVPVTVARRTWRVKALAELLANHPERPSLSVDGDEYVIWNYSEHQQTVAERKAVSEKNTANGAKGGRPAKRNPHETQSVPKNNPHETEPKAESESESELEIDRQDTHTSSPVPYAESYPQGPDEIESVEAICARQAASLGVDFGKVKTAIGKACGRFPQPSGVMAIIATVLERAKPPIKSPTGVVLAAVRNDWAEWQQYLDEVAS